jgi:hypothetical protein
MNREFNFGVADAGDAGTSLLFQWRRGPLQHEPAFRGRRFRRPEGKGERQAHSGWAVRLPVHAGQRRDAARLSRHCGVGFAFGDGGNIARIPFGVSIGHRFPLDQGFAITPYVHPRVSIDFCSDCGGSNNDQNETDLGIDFDLGANFEVTKQLSFRVSILFGGSDTFGDSDGFGLSLAWSPPQLSKLIRR